MIRFLIAALFFLSGITGLVYEVVWSKFLAQIFGNTAHAHAVILGVFLGGIAVGNAVLGPRVDKIKRPLHLYAWLEILIALCGVLVPKVLLAFSHAIDDAAAAGSLETGPLGGLRLAGALSVLLVPTFLMGGTLPAISRFLARSLAQVGRSVSMLYFLNSGGAALGAFLAGFWLIPNLGLMFAGTTAALLNLAVGAAALVLSQRVEGARGAKAAAVPTEGAARAYTARQARIVVVAVFFSGFVSLVYEIAWIRLLALILGASTYSFTLMLSAFIAGIAVGSLAVMRLVKPKHDAYLLFGGAELLAGAAVLLSFPLYAKAPYYFHVLRSLLMPIPEAFPLYQAGKLAMCFLLMFVPTLFIGATLPLAGIVATRSAAKVGASIGGVFAVNTLGNVLGAVAAGLVLLPALGMQDMLEIGAVLNVLIGGGVLWTARAWDRRRRLAFAGAAAAALVVHLGVTGSWDKRALTRGDFRLDPNLRARSYDDYRRMLDEYKILFYKDGANTTVTVTEKDGNLRQLRVNGKVDASNGLPDMITQGMLGHLPLLLHPQAERALIIGYGVGMTLGAVLKHPVTHVDVAEISPAVIEAAPLFDDMAGGALADPRVRLHLQDGRTVLKTGGEAYDVIISEPSNPWIAGIADLFSTQFFEQARARLKPGGVMIQWLQAYETSDEIMQMILRTYRRVFPHVELWRLSSDFLLVGSIDRRALDFAATTARMREPQVAADLQRINLTEPTTLFALHMADDAFVEDIARSIGPVNDDMFPTLEYQAPRALYSQQSGNFLESRDLRLRAAPGGLALPRYLAYRGRGMRAAEYADIVKYLQLSQTAIRGRFLSAWLAAYPDDEAALWERTQGDVRFGRLDRARRTLQTLLARSARRADYLDAAAQVEIMLFTQGRSYLHAASPAKALQLLERLRRAEPARALGALRRMAMVHEEAGDWAAAARHFELAAAAGEKAGAAPEQSQALRERAAFLRQAKGR